MKNFKWWPVLGLAATMGAALTGCGSSGSSGDASVRLLNATLAHPSLDLLVNSAAAVSTVTTDTVSTYVTPGSGSVVLQINDAGRTTALATIQPTIGNGAHVTVVAYEVNGVVRTTVLPEDAVLPVSGASALRVLDSSLDAGALDIYVTAPAATGSTPDLGTLAPSFSLAAQNFVQFPDAATFTPGTYEVVVTGQGNKSDVRADIKNVVLASQQLGLIVLTPASGGVLLNGGVLLQQMAGYTTGRNTNARVRLVAGVSGSPQVSAMAGNTQVASARSPSVGSYATVPAIGSSNNGTLAVSVAGVAQTVPVTTLAAGSDNTLLVTGSAAAPLVQLLADDNHLPATSTNLKIRVVNGLTGANASPITLSYNFSTFAGAAGVQPGAASIYGSLAVPSNSAGSQIDVTSASGGTVYSRTGLALSANSVYTLFLLGDYTPPALPLAQLSQDR